MVASGCATIVSREQVISIDSDIRGAKVSLIEPGKKTTPVGQTPTFLKIRRQSEIPLALTGPHVQKQTNYTVDCKFRWGTVLAGNLIFYYLWPLAVGVDYWTGNAFDCPLKNDIKLEAVVAPAQQLFSQECKVYFLVFPAETSNSSMTFVWQSWTQQKISGCNSLVSLEETIDNRDRFNLHSGFDEFDSSTRRRFFEVGNEFAVTHFVLIKFSKLDDVDQDLEYSIVDIHSEKSVEKARVKIDAEKYVDFNSGFTKTAVNLGIDLIPNSIAFAPVYDTTVDHDIHTNIEIDETKNRLSSLSALMSNWSLRNIDHPLGYEDWDFSFRFTPDFTLRYFNQYNRYHFVDKPSEKTDYNFLTYSAVATANAELNLHTAFGAIAFSLGFGPGYEYYKGDNNDTKHFFRGFVRANFGYTVFVTENWFFRVFSSATNPIASPIKTPFSTISSSQISGWEIGYYFPWVRSSVHDILRR